MKYELFARLYSEARVYSDLDTYIAERGWQEWMEDYSAGDSLDASLIADVLGRIYRIASATLSELREMTGMSRAEFGRVYHIPVSTLESWEYDLRNLADYKIMLIAYTVFCGEVDFHADQKD